MNVIEKLVSFLFSFQLEQTDEITTIVCRMCADKIVELNQFQLMYIESDRKLRHLLLLKSEIEANQPDIIKSEDNSSNEAIFCDDQSYLSDTNISIKNESRKFNCRSCSRSFQTRDLFREHKRIHTASGLKTESGDSEGNIEPQLKDIGGIRSSQRPKYRHANDAGAAIHQTEDDQSFASSNISSDEAQTTENHMEPSRRQEPKCRKRKAKSSTTRKWTCNKCYEKFNVREALREHKKFHKVADGSGENVRGEFICDFCGKICVTKQKIRQHMGSHDSTRTKERHLCNVCGMWLSSKRNLNIHNRVVHIGEKKHKCRFCDRSFSSSQHLKIHINRHEGIRPYACKQCSKTFFTGSERKEHMHSVHLNDKKFGCQICARTFNRSGNLRAHMFTHTRQYPHLCKRCGTGFVRKNRLVQHLDVCCRDGLVNS